MSDREHIYDNEEFLAEAELTDSPVTLRESLVRNCGMEVTIEEAEKLIHRMTYNMGLKGEFEDALHDQLGGIRARAILGAVRFDQRTNPAAIYDELVLLRRDTSFALGVLGTILRAAGREFTPLSKQEET